MITVWKAFDKALETYSPTTDWRWLGESFRHQMFDDVKLSRFREFCVGFSIADSNIHRARLDESGGAPV